jgi:hypothetical protein
MQRRQSKTDERGLGPAAEPSAVVGMDTLHAAWEGYSTKPSMT